MKILVTGANGYIGLHIVKTLLDKGIQVIACDLNTDEVDKRAERKNIDLFTLPDTNIYTLLGTPDVCLHLAWRNGFVHNASTHLGDLSAHYRFLTRIIDDGLPQLAVMGTMHEIGYWEGAIDENTPCLQPSFHVWHRQRCSPPLYDAIRPAKRLYFTVATGILYSRR